MSTPPYTKPLDDLDDEEELVDRRPLVFLVLAAVLFVVYVLAARIFVVVGVGEGAVLYRPLFHGLVLDRVYGEGLHVNFPWDTMTVYDLRIQERPIEYPVLNGNGLELRVKMSVRYHPRRESLAFLHQQIGPEYERKLVVPVVEYCVRNAIGSSSVNDIYANHGDMLGQIQRSVANMLAEKYIELDGLVFREIALPERINVAIQDKEVQRQVLEAYEFRLRTATREALRLQIEGTGRRGYNTIVRSSLDELLLKWEGILATRDLSKSDNAKVVVIGSGPAGLPIILGNDPAPKGSAAVPGTGGSGEMSFTELNHYLREFEGKLQQMLHSAPLDVTSNAAAESGVSEHDSHGLSPGGLAQPAAGASPAVNPPLVPPPAVPPPPLQGTGEPSASPIGGPP